MTFKNVSIADILNLKHLLCMIEINVKIILSLLDRYPNVCCFYGIFSFYHVFGMKIECFLKSEWANISY